MNTSELKTSADCFEEILRMWQENGESSARLLAVARRADRVRALLRRFVKLGGDVKANHLTELSQALSQ